jgi:hypothetical protein
MLLSQAESPAGGADATGAWQGISRDWLHLVTAALLIIVFLYGLLVLPIHLDDVYITARYARNLAAGEGFVYNQGERILGTTTPLLTLIQAATMLVFSPEEALRLVSAALLALASFMFLLYGRRFGEPLAGFGAACALPATAFAYEFFGNEFTLCIILFLGTVILIVDKRLVAAGLLAGVGKHWLKLGHVAPAGGGAKAIF